MFFDLDVPVPEPALPPLAAAMGAKKDRKGKGRAQDEPAGTAAPAPPLLFKTSMPSRRASNSSPKAIPSFAWILHDADAQEPVGYTVLVLSQTLRAPIDPKSHINVLTALLPVLRPPPGVALATRLTLVLGSD